MKIQLLEPRARSNNISDVHYASFWSLPQKSLCQENAKLWSFVDNTVLRIFFINEEKLSRVIVTFNE